jgi:REP element-mobilizing transposase RayT
MNRAAGRRTVFRTDDDRFLAVELFADFDARFGVEIHAYCLMGNHFHLLVRSREGRLSEAMKWFGAEFTRRVNARRDVDGAVFRGRFHSVSVERDAHLVWLFRYVNANPIELGWVRPLAEYRWSGLGAMTGARPPCDWLCADFVEAHFGSDGSRLERFVEEARRDAATPFVGVVDDAAVQAAVRISRIGGPEAYSKAELRAAHTLVALDVGLPATAVSTIDDLSEVAGERYIDRIRRRLVTTATLPQLVATVNDALAVEIEFGMTRRSSQLIAARQSVSDTD